MPTPVNIRYFRTPAALRAWFQKHHASASEQWIGYYKKDSGVPSITWPESVDQALCFGWIDGVRKSVDAERYTIRFTPRKKGSIWSTVNRRRVKELEKEGLMTEAGRGAFNGRDTRKQGMYSFEQKKDPALSAGFLRIFRHSAKAWRFFSAQTASYRKAAVWWVVTAKQEATKMKRLEQLIRDSGRGMTVPHLTPRRRRTEK